MNLNQIEDEENESRDANDGEFDYMYDSCTGYFYQGTFNSKLRRYLNKTRVPDISRVDRETIEAAREEPNTWISPALGDPWDEPPPRYLTTKVPTLYQQLNRPFCLTYCLASALFYCKFRVEASLLAGQAIDLACYNMRAQLRRVLNFMPNLVPLIGDATRINHRANGNCRRKRRLKWEELFDELSSRPTLIVPVNGRTGRMNHAICVVDDLIFDSSTPYAMKLCMDSFRWIFQEDNLDIFVAYRFENKVSPPGQKIAGQYTREIVYNWNQDAKRRVFANKILSNKAYDVEPMETDKEDVLVTAWTTLRHTLHHVFSKKRSQRENDDNEDEVHRRDDAVLINYDSDYDSDFEPQCSHDSNSFPPVLVSSMDDTSMECDESDQNT